MSNVLIVDAETTGINPQTDRVIEIGYVLWSVDHLTMLEVYSGLLSAPENPAEHVNAIPAAALQSPQSDAWTRLAEAAGHASVILAHNATFDHGFLMPHGDIPSDLTWVCTMDDFEWPAKTESKSLVGIALAMGVGVVAAHRAVNDCLLLARMLERLGTDAPLAIADAVARARRPKARFIARVSYERKDEAKAHGFRWDPATRQWWRLMAVEDAKALPFPVWQWEGV